MMLPAGPLTSPARPVARTLYDIAHALSTAWDAEAGVHHALELLARLVPYNRCAVLEARPGSEPRLVLTPDAPLERAALRYALGRYIELLAEDRRPKPGGLPPVAARLVPWPSHLVVPLLDLDRVVGVLFVGRDVPEAYDEEDLSLVSVVASQFAAYLTALHHRQQEAARAGELARLYEAERRAREDAEAARSALATSEARLRLLAEASAVLAGSLDYEVTLHAVAHLTVPELADLCVLDVLEEDGRLRRLATAHAGPAKERLLSEALRGYPSKSDRPNPARQVLGTGQSVLLPTVPEQFVESLALDAEDVAFIREIGPRSAMIVPLLARGRTLGAIVLALGGPGRRYSGADLPLAEELARRAALAVDNARLHQQLQQAVRMRDEFLATVSHDLKAPLTVIKVHAQQLLQWVTRGDAEKADRMAGGLQKIDAMAMTMATALDELLDVTRLQVGEQLELRRQPADLVALARRVAAQRQETTKRHRIRVEAAEEDLVGSYDAARLERVLDNLLGNAAKYSPQGGDIEVTLARADDSTGTWAVIAIRDHGLGIPAADLPYVFDRFRRGGNVAGQIAGTGIGLAGARQIIEQHGGTISVESQEGAGSTFTVRLPLPAA